MPTPPPVRDNSDIRRVQNIGIVATGKLNSVVSCSDVLNVLVEWGNFCYDDKTGLVKGVMTVGGIQVVVKRKFGGRFS